MKQSRGLAPVSPPDALSPTLPVSFRIPESKTGQRLDAALAVGMPGLGLRARRRLWDWCRIAVNGKAQNPGFTVCAGDAVDIRPMAGLPAGEKEIAADAFIQERAALAGYLPEIIAANPDFIALQKPEGLHSAHIAGSRSDSLELRLARYWPELQENQPQTGGMEEFPVPRLLTRLDQATSGLVLAACHAGAEQEFRELEKQGKVRKSYFALVAGRLEKPLRIRNRLNTANRASSLVLGEDDPDSTRHSTATPLKILEDAEGACLDAFTPGIGATLLKVEIQRGARHQIRAHLAHAGFPLLGEWLYASDEGHEQRKIYLHHARLELPGFTAACLPDWDFLTATDLGL